MREKLGACMAVLSESKLIVLVELSGPANCWRWTLGTNSYQATPSDVIAAMSGRVVDTSQPLDRAFSWRFGRIYGEWFPPGKTPMGTVVSPDPKPAVVVGSPVRARNSPKGVAS
jgi:hypothetical protein